jgi:hypothetical protein
MRCDQMVLQISIGIFATIMVFRDSLDKKLSLTPVVCRMSRNVNSAGSALTSEKLLLQVDCELSIAAKMSTHVVSEVLMAHI